ncbi:hypothetical protein Lal_00012066 [Lupinus albus]|nr:hypothetical protein Lal_00012066 [Lupinus albus]
MERDPPTPRVGGKTLTPHHDHSFLGNPMVSIERTKKAMIVQIFNVSLGTSTGAATASADDDVDLGFAKSKAVKD